MSGITGCRCCSSLSRVSRVRLNHDRMPTPTLASITLQKRGAATKPLPKRDWSIPESSSSSTNPSPSQSNSARPLAGFRPQSRDWSRPQSFGAGDAGSSAQGGFGGGSGGGGNFRDNGNRGGSWGARSGGGQGQSRPNGFRQGNFNRQGQGNFGSEPLDVPKPGGFGLAKPGQQNRGGNGSQGQDRSGGRAGAGGAFSDFIPQNNANQGFNRFDRSTSDQGFNRFDRSGSDQGLNRPQYGQQQNAGRFDAPNRAPSRSAEFVPDMSFRAGGDPDLEGNSRAAQKRREKKMSRWAREVEEGEEDEIVRGRGAKKTGSMSKAALAYEMGGRKRLPGEVAAMPQKVKERKVVIPSMVSVSHLAGIFEVKLFRLQATMARMGMEEDARRPDFVLNGEQAVDLALEFNLNPIIDDDAGFDIRPMPDPEGVELPLRPPVVTIMGHVDHGKTTLLDSLRDASVAEGEAGGITQHIGAFSVPLSKLVKSDNVDTGASITFLDTPGHAAFTGMRARGASVTDIVVLVVAADDGVMPQTREVLKLVEDEGDNVGMVVAINKIDKPGVDVEQVKAALGAEGIYLEEDGGDVQSVRVSGLSKIGLDNLVETLSTLAELRELRARTEGQAEGWILESNVDKGHGRVATVLVTRGTLRVGACIVAGTTWCRVRTMHDDKGGDVRAATPGTPVVVTGWKDLPDAGEQLLESTEGEANARKAVRNRVKERERMKMLGDVDVINVKRRIDRLKLEEEDEARELVKAQGGNWFQTRLDMARKETAEAKLSEVKELRLIIKGDVSGTVEAVEGSLVGIGNKEAKVRIISSDVGDLTESDVSLAEAAGALIIGFNVDAPRPIRTFAKELNVDFHLETVIYRLIETVRQKTAALLPPRIEYRVIGEANVLQVFEVTKGKTKVSVAGCRVSNGNITRTDKVRVLRGPERTPVFEGSIDTLKHLKKDVPTVRKGTECGISFEGFDDIRADDQITTFSTHEIPREL